MTPYFNRPSLLCRFLDSVERINSSPTCTYSYYIIRTAIKFSYIASYFKVVCSKYFGFLNQGSREMRKVPHAHIAYTVNYTRALYIYMYNIAIVVNIVSC